MANRTFGSVWGVATHAIRVGWVGEETSYYSFWEMKPRKPWPREISPLGHIGKSKRCCNTMGENVFPMSLLNFHP